MIQWNLIVQAEAEGRISAEQSLIYRLWAIFHDPALPAEFQAPPGPYARSRGGAFAYIASVLQLAEYLPPEARERVLAEHDRLWG
jgi:hypothetical protein